jgi:lipoprotein-releasing system permease protein
MTIASSFLLAVRYLLGRRADPAGKRLRRKAQTPGDPTTPRRRSVGGRRVRGGIIGVGLSLVPLVVVLQVTDGMIAGITTRFIEAGSYHIQAISRTDSTLDEVRRVTAEIEGVPGVTVASPERQGLGLAASEGERTGVTIRALEHDQWERDEGLRTYLEFTSGAWDLTDDRSILLGTEIARLLDVGVGDSVNLVVARPLSGGRFLPRSAGFTVRGVFTSGYQDLDRLWVIVPFERGFSLLPDAIARQVIGVKINDPLTLPNPLYRAPATNRGREAVQASGAALAAIREIGDSDWRVATWFDLERSKYMSFKTTKNLLIFIMVLIVLVAAVNISSTLVMLVLEKQDEIAILKSLGASPGGIRRLFVFAGFLLGTAGTIAGISVGLLLAASINQVLYAIEWALNAVATAGAWLARPFVDIAAPAIELLSGDYYLESIPFALRGADLLLIAGLSILLSTAAAYFPARRAARLRPLEILQKR